MSDEGVYDAEQGTFLNLILNGRESSPEEMKQEAEYQEFDKERNAIDALFMAAKNYRDGPQFKKMLDFCSRFKKMAPYNALLVMLQRPGASMVLSPSGWLRLNRHINNDARPIITLAPFWPCTFKFDLADTHVIEGRRDLVPKDVSEPFRCQENLVKPELFQNLISNLPYYGIRYERMITGNDYAGKLQSANRSTRPIAVMVKRNVFIRWESYYFISTSDRFAITEQFATVVHELGHFFCGHLPCLYPKKAYRERLNLSHEQCEFEAETVSWLICSRRGIKKPSMEYLAGYLVDGKEIPNVSVARILQAVTLIEWMLAPAVGIQGCWLVKYDSDFREACNKIINKAG